MMRTINKFILAIMIALMSAIAIAAVGDFSISGQTPTQRMDDSALGLSEIAGFNMHCGTTIGDYQDTTFYAGATLPDTTWLVTGLSVGTHYCVITTLDIDGRESDHSNMITLVNVGKSRPTPPWIEPDQVITVNTTTLQ